jgi:hypothetical protein
VADGSPIHSLLALRAWALRLLAEGSAPPPPAISDALFRVFLAAERVAGPLASRIGPVVPPVLQEQALRDGQVTLLRDAALAEVARFGQEGGFPVVALKSAAHRTRLPSVDLDVLVPADRLGEMAAHLGGSGYRAFRGYAEGPGLHPIHLPGRARPGEMTIELHHQLGDGLSVDDRIWGALRPHPTQTGCYRLPAARHAWHLLWHSIVPHPQRRGQLGDLLLLAESLGELDDPGREWLRSHAASHAHAGRLVRALSMAEGMAGGTRPADEFRAVAAAQYCWRTSRVLQSLPKRPAKMLETVWFDLVDGGTTGDLWSRVVLTDGAASARPWLYALERRAPSATRAGRIVARGVVFALILPAATMLSHRMRRYAGLG